LSCINQLKVGRKLFFFLYQITAKVCRKQFYETKMDFFGGGNPKVGPAKLAWLGGIPFKIYLEHCFLK